MFWLILLISSSGVGLYLSREIHSSIEQAMYSSHIRAHTVGDIILSPLLRTFIIGWVATAVLVASGIRIIFSRVSRSLLRLREALSRVKAGDLSFQLQPYPGEVSLEAHGALNQAISSLATNFSHLKAEAVQMERASEVLESLLERNDFSPSSWAPALKTLRQSSQAFQEKLSQFKF